MSTAINFHADLPAGLKLQSFFPENRMCLTLVCGKGGTLSIFGATPAQAWAIFDALSTPATFVYLAGYDSITVRGIEEMRAETGGPVHVRQACHHFDEVRARTLAAAEDAAPSEDADLIEEAA
jgi:hypothetical protein